MTDEEIRNVVGNLLIAAAALTAVQRQRLIAHADDLTAASLALMCITGDVCRLARDTEDEPRRTVN